MDTFYHNRKYLFFIFVFYFFPNLYGVSIVKSEYSYGGEDGLWELAVLEGDEDEWELTYSTPITSNVLGYLTEDEVNEIVDKVIAL